MCSRRWRGKPGGQTGKQVCHESARVGGAHRLAHHRDSRGAGGEANRGIAGSDAAEGQHRQWPGPSQRIEAERWAVAGLALG
jgi:hypothetical protein